VTKQPDLIKANPLKQTEMSRAYPLTQNDMMEPDIHKKSDKANSPKQSNA
jgi:hypothetical protein